MSQHGRKLKEIRKHLQEHPADAVVYWSKQAINTLDGRDATHHPPRVVTFSMPEIRTLDTMTEEQRGELASHYGAPVAQRFGKGRW